MNKRQSVGILAVISIVVLALPVRAQELAVGRITGIIRDPAGSVVDGASVVARGETTGVTFKTVSDHAGAYAFDDVPIGSYSMTVSDSGFETQVSTGVRVISGQSRALDFTLTVGKVTQTVSVTAAPPVLDTTGNAINTTMTTEEIADLPYAIAGTRGRQAVGAVELMNGVNFSPSSGGSTAIGGKTEYVVGRAVINGAPQSQQGYYEDGAYSAAQGHEPTEEFVFEPPESVSEVSLMADQNAEYGWNSGTGYEITFKSGTNHVHGNAYDYVRNTSLDSRNFFAATRSVNKQNDFGGDIGGPVILPKIYNGKDRTFFFVSYDGFRFRTASAATIDTVPTAQMLDGDFSQLLGPQIGTDALARPVYSGEVYDPSTTNTLANGSVVRNQFPGNIIPPGSLSSISKFFQSGYPLPNRAGIVNNWVGLPPSERTQTNILNGKFDQVLTSNQRLSFGWGNVLNDADYNTSDNGLAPLINSSGNNIESEYRFRVNYDWTVRPNLLLNVSTGVVRTPSRNAEQPYYRQSFSGGAQAGLTGVLSPYTPSVSILNYTGFGEGATYYWLVNQGNNAAVNLSWIKGSHNLKFGAQYEFIRTGQTLNAGTGGSFSFSNLETGIPGYTATGSGYASYLLGAVDTGSLDSFNLYPTSMQGAWAFYAQDQWRVTRKLTLNYGLRWNLFVPTRILGNRIGSFDPTEPNPGVGGRLGAVTFWGSGAGRNGLIDLYNYYYKDFEPRIGIVYELTPKTVVRAYYGLNSPAHFGDFTSGGNVPTVGWSATETDSSLNNGVTPAFNWNNGFPIPIPQLPDLDPSIENHTGTAFFGAQSSGVQYIDRIGAAKPGRVQNINVGVERQLPGQMDLRAYYVGTLAHALPTGYLYEMNQLPVADLSLGNLLLASINSPQAQAAGIPLPYTGFTGSVAQALLPYPQYTGGIPVHGAPAGYSEYNSMQLNIQKRFGYGNFAQSGHGIWPNQVPGAPVATGNGCGLSPHSPTDEYLNANAFADPAPFTLGNRLDLPNVRGCPYFTENFGLMKDFTMHENTKLELGTYWFNAFNRHQFLGLQTNIDVPSAFGQFTQASTPRQIMVYLKLSS